MQMTLCKVVYLCLVWFFARSRCKMPDWHSAVLGICGLRVTSVNRLKFKYTQQQWDRFCCAAKNEPGLPQMRSVKHLLLSEPRLCFACSTLREIIVSSLESNLSVLSHYSELWSSREWFELGGCIVCCMWADLLARCTLFLEAGKVCQTEGSARFASWLKNIKKLN